MRITIESGDTIKINEAQVSKWKAQKSKRLIQKLQKILNSRLSISAIPPHHIHTHTHTPRNLPIIRTYTQRGKRELMIKEGSGRE